MEVSCYSLGPLLFEELNVRYYGSTLRSFKLVGTVGHSRFNKALDKAALGLPSGLLTSYVKLYHFKIMNEGNVNLNLSPEYGNL